MPAFAAHTNPVAMPLLPLSQELRTTGTAFVLVHGLIDGLQVQAPPVKSVRYEVLIPQLVQAAMDPAIHSVLIALHTIGGDVDAGLAIAETIATLGKPTASVILGSDNSIGLPVAVAADRTFITPTGSIAVHPVRGSLVVNTPESFQQIAAIQDRVIRFTVEHSRISEKRLKYLMSRRQLPGDVGTLLSGQDAVTEGIIDSLGGVADALGYLRRRNEGASA
ncbi:MAG: ATP-dependent Clp protease proteolytic subunit [Firmicutes bacterium]|nr:ATP-dependent Clp protease proteolytic subunit [Bacillota bacterium]